MVNNSMKQFVETPVWNAQNNKVIWEMYLKDTLPSDLLLASHMHNELPNDIPDTYVETAEFDCLHDEAVLYAYRLQEAGANVTIHETKGTIHGYDSIISSSEAINSIKKRIHSLKSSYKLM